ncbi:hypothetical protein PG999_002521 [Apiospora kogelbergensis]|uniref:Uncharacterized protein n=1 Tax=Apiospora kogelbergensis TaxID=1337665 RepID=A0AAW0R8N4_9PEZI
MPPNEKEEEVAGLIVAPNLLTSGQKVRKASRAKTLTTPTSGRNVPMFRTWLPVCPAGVFTGGYLRRIDAAV